MKALVRRSDHCIALGIERDDGVRIPVSGVPSPTSWGACPGVRVELMAPVLPHVILLPSASSERLPNSASGPHFHRLHATKRRAVWRRRKEMRSSAAGNIPGEGATRVAKEVS